jgi:IS5 family transposase
MKICKERVEADSKLCKNICMKPVKISHDPQGELFKTELLRIINMTHPLVRLGNEVNWDRLEEVFGESYCENNGRPATSTRLLVALHYLKYTFNLSDEDVVAAWVENPYWQHFSGNQYFAHTPPIDPSVMSRFRKRIGEAGAEELLKETIEAGLKLKAIKPNQLKRVNVDTTVQEKEIRYPTDARLYNRSRERLVKAAAQRGIDLRQNYNFVAKHQLLMSHRYAHARQMNRSRKCTRKLRTILGRVIRDIERKTPAMDQELGNLLSVARQIHAQERKDKGKIYSVHEPHVECISKGKAHKRYEFGCKVSVAATSKGGWFVGAKAVHGNPYDGHTLNEAMEQVKRIANEPEQAFADMGYRGHNYEGPCEVHVDKRRRGGTARSLWRWMKRRAAIEPGIGHLKREHRMDRCRLKGIEGDQLNAVLSATGMNFRKLLKAASRLRAFLRPVFAQLFEALEQPWRSFRLRNLFADRQDQIIAVA